MRMARKIASFLYWTVTALLVVLAIGAIETKPLVAFGAVGLALLLVWAAGPMDRRD